MNSIIFCKNLNIYYQTSQNSLSKPAFQKKKSSLSNGISRECCLNNPEIIEAISLFLTVKERRTIYPLVCKQFNNTLKENKALLKEDQTHAIVHHFFKHPYQKWIIPIFGKELLISLPIIPFSLNKPQRAFNTLNQLGMRMAIGKTRDSNYSNYGLILTFQRMQDAELFFKCLFTVNLAEPLQENVIPLTRAQILEKKRNKQLAIEALISSRNTPITPSQDPAGLLFFKCIGCISLHNVNNAVQ